MIGMFANALPLRVDVDPRQGLRNWVERTFAAREALQGFEHCSLARLLEAGGLSPRRPPFDSLVTYANFPGSGANDRRTSEEALGEDRPLELVGLRGDVTSAYPLTIAITPGAAVRGRASIRAHYDGRLFTDSAVEALLERFGSLVEGVIVQAPSTVGELLSTAPGDLRTDSRLRRPASSGQRRRRSQAADEPEQAASTVTESQLMRIWNDLIEVREFGVDDNFFDLGGHSLLVPQMIARVRQDFGIDLPLGAIFGTPTVRELARAIESQDPASSWRSLVSIRARGYLPPLYMVHGLGGEIGWFYNLANYLDPDMPLFGLQAPVEPFSDLERMAAHYVGEIRTQRPHGPYRLGGYCVGGGVAFEMARQLLAAGQRVDSLILIDSVPQSHAVGEQVNAPARWARRARHLIAKEPRAIVDSIRDFGQRTARRLSRTVARPQETGQVELEDVLDMRTLPLVYRAAATSHFRAMRDYTPRPYDGDVWLFRTDDERFGEDFGWRPLVEGELHIERIPGRHNDVLDEPHVGGLGRKVALALDPLVTA